jgi:hypothetical protein
MALVAQRGWCDVQRMSLAALLFFSKKSIFYPLLV